MQTSKKLTIFTPTYNRAHTLDRCYQSLISQTCDNFIWLIIDDGSIDNTKNLVESWIHENLIEIQYVYKKNGGMHTAHNTAYDLIKTELNVCIDSDDYMPIDAVEKIIQIWNKLGSKKYAGIIGLDADYNDQIIGDKFPDEIDYATLTEIYQKYKVKGDKKIVYRTDIIKSVSKYPEFEGEKLVPLSYKYKLVDQKYKLILVNEILCNVEYQLDGSSNTIMKQYMQSPKGFIEYRKLMISLNDDWNQKFKHIIHYICSNIILKNNNYIKESPCKVLTALLSPLGLILYTYIKLRNIKIDKNNRST